MSIELETTLEEVNAEIEKLNKYIIDLEAAPRTKDTDRLSIGAKLDLIELAANRDEMMGTKLMSMALEGLGAIA